ncbi:MAG: c-type cytochrome biogenesis protein CcsB, partial [Candidatus Sericytochromatia bacterium]|nr:c-type cytochrome biogenesis protein CcsB [Candidatus Sericytochromatia bacterium]
EKAGFWALLGATLAMVGAISARVVLSGRGPVSNFYEAMLWLIGIAMIVVIVVDRTYKPPYFAAMAVPFLLILLGVTYLFPADWKEIHPLVPALRSYWLKIHVTVIVSSYGAFAVSFVTSLLYLFFRYTKVKPGADGLEAAEIKRKKLLELFDEVTYRTILLGVPLLGIGTILGGIWANEAWGTYWSWDPKETWALITFLIYIAYLHTRLMRGVTGDRAIWFSLIGFAAVIFTFFGVNYLPGLHSYGFSNTPAK